MTFGEWINKKRESNWFLLGIVLIVTIGICVAIAISIVTKFYLLLLALLPLLAVSFVFIWIGILQGIFGKDRISPALRLVVGMIALIVLSWGFYWSMSTINVTESTSWMKDGTTTIFSGIAGALAYDMITKLSK